MKNKSSIVQAILNISIVVFIACFFILRIKTGEYLPLPLAASILIALVGVSRIIANRRKFHGNEEGRRQYNKIVVKSVILAPIIAIAFIALVVFIKLKLG